MVIKTYLTSIAVTCHQNHMESEGQDMIKDYI